MTTTRKSNNFEGKTFGHRAYLACNLFGEDGGIPGPRWWDLTSAERAAWEGVGAAEAIKGLISSGEIQKYFDMAMERDID